MAYRIQYRRATAAVATANNVVLAAGEPGLETDTGKVKLGDGITAWNALAYEPSTGSLAAAKSEAIAAAAIDATTKAGDAQAAGEAAAAAVTVTTLGAITPDGVDTKIADERVSERALQNSTFGPGGSARNPAVDDYGRPGADTSMRRGALPRIVSLVTGQTDETPISSGTGTTVVADTVNSKIGGRGWAVVADRAGGPGVSFAPISPAVGAGVPRAVPAAQAVVVWFYVPDATKLSDAGVYIYNDAALTTPNRWGRSMTNSPAQTIVNGWNMLRTEVSASAAEIRDIYRLTFYFVCNAATTVTVGHVYLECPEKARLLIINDGAYKSFDLNAYPVLKAMGVPVTYAPALAAIGTDAGLWSEHVTLDRLRELSKENRNSVSFHSWASEVTSAMTADQYRAETTKAVKQMQDWGFAGRMWRAAITQNSAPQFEASRDLVVGSCSGTNSSSPTPWPPKDMMHIYRNALDDTAVAPIGNARVDAWMTYLQRTHSMYVVFLHGVGAYPDATTGNTFNCAQPLFDYFAAEVAAGIAEGWLECVTFEQLFYESGGSFANIGGSNVATYTDGTGARVVKNVL